MKYAFTYKPHREVTEFVGPFDSHEEMRKAMIWLANDDDTGTDHMIEDSLYHDHDLDYLRGTLRIAIYEVNEVPLDSADFTSLCDDWREEIDKKNKRYDVQAKEHERKEYERLKKKFGDEA